MAHPLYIAENAVKSFIDHWLIGLQPSLRLTTRFDGSIVVESDVISAPVLLPQKPVYDHFYRRHKSGNLARQRRKIIRTLNPPSPSKQKQDSLSICPSKLSTVDTAVQAVKVLVDVACETTQPVPVPPRKILSVENVSQTDIPPRKIYLPLSMPRKPFMTSIQVIYHEKRERNSSFTFSTNVHVVSQLKLT